MTRAGPRRRRVWIAAAMIAALCAAAVLSWALGAFTERRDFRSESEALLEALSSADPATLERVYDRAAFPFRETLLIASFEDLAGRMRGTFGDFRGIVAVLENHRVPSLGGQTATVKYLVRYERATTTATLSYLDPEGEQGWQLLGLDVAIPPELEDAATQLAADENRVAAPRAVDELFRRILDLAAKGDIEGILAVSSPPFRESVTADSLRTQLDTRSRELGAFRGVVTILSSAQNDARDRAHIDALLEYERGRTTGSFEFIAVDGQWKLLSMKILIPQPLLPSR